MAKSSFLAGLSSGMKNKVAVNSNHLDSTQKSLLEKEFKLTLNELSKITSPENDEDYRCLLMGHILFQLHKEGPIGILGIGYIKCFEFLYSKDFSFKRDINVLFLSIVTSEIRICRNVDDIFEWVKEILPLKNYDADIKPIQDFAEIKYVSFLMERISHLLINPTDVAVINFLLDLEKGQKIQLNIDKIVKMALRNICSFLESRIGIDQIYPDAKSPSKDYKIERTCLGCIERVRFDGEELVIRVQKIRSVIGESISLDQLGQPGPEILPEPKRELDFNKLELKEPIYVNNTTNFSVVIRKASYPDYPQLVVKEYTAYHSIEDLDRFSSEIEIMQKISDLANDSNCFLKYYGSWVEGAKLSLVMEYAEENLMTVITRLKRTGKKITEDQLKAVSHKLVSSFAQLESMGIYHQDIKPHNILATHDLLQIKIIDFSIAEVKPSTDIATFATGLVTVQGTRGYTAPEIEDLMEKGQDRGSVNVSKADVFSLGLTLLQLVTLEDLHTLNRSEFHERLMDKINCVPYEWFNSLLKSMLALNHKERRRFKKLLTLELIPTGSGSTFQTKKN